MNDINEDEFQSAFDIALSNFIKEECLSILASDIKSNTKENNYKLQLATTYFKENIDSFDQDEIKQIFSNKYFVKKIGKNFAQTIMIKCVHLGISLIDIPKDWISKNIKKDLIKSYLKIINEENNKEQLMFFIQSHKQIVKEFIHERNNISPALADLYLVEDPSYIFKVNWDEEKICSWINDHNDVKETLFSSFLNTFPKLPSKVENLLLDGIGQKFLNVSSNEKEIQFKQILVTKNNIKHNFFKNLEKKYPTEYNKVLSSKIVNDNYPYTEFNFAQYLLLWRNFTSLNELQDFFAPYKELLLEPIIKTTGLYDRKLSIFEYGVDNSNFMPFAPFSLNDNLTPEHKDQLVAGAFCLLQHKHGVYRNCDDEDNYGGIYNYKSISQYWYSNIIQQATDEQFNYYSKKALKDNNKEDLKKDLEQIKLYRDLQNDLDNNGAISKKLKI